MKKSLIALLALCATLGFAACGDTEDKGNNGGGTGGGETPAESYEVTKAEWESALQFDLEQFSYTVSGQGSWEVYTIDGDILKIGTVGAPERYFSKEDGKYYAYEKSGEEWFKSAIPQEEYTSYFEDLYDITEFYVFEEFTYNAELKGYVAESVGEEVLYSDFFIQFEDGKVVKNSFEIFNMTWQVSYDYTVEALTLPNATLVVSTEIETQEAWEEAWALVAPKSEDSRTIYFTIKQDGVEDPALVWEVRVAENLIYTSMPYYDQVYEMAEDGEIYAYMKEPGKAWTKEHRTGASYRPWDYLLNSATTMGGHGEYVKGCENLEDATYDEDGKFYTYTVDECSYWAYFEGGKLIKLEVVPSGLDEGMYYEFVFDYSVPTIEVPQV